MEYIGIIMSVTALFISAMTFWLTRIKKGTVKMTRPTIVCFVPANGGDNSKIFIRTLLYSTSDKGQYIQNMYARLQRGESIQNFNVWAYQDKDLVRGSGLFVNKSGIALSHHFLLPNEDTHYKFLSGEYIIQIFAETVDKKPTVIFEYKLTLTEGQQQGLIDKRAIFYNWAPNTQTYVSHIDGNHKKDNDKRELLNKITGLNQYK